VNRAATVIATCLLLACNNDFVKGWEVDRTRVLGARVETDRVEWLVARAAHSEWSYAVCTDTHLNAPRCDTPVTAASGGTSEDEVVTMPTGPLAPSSLVLAAFCVVGPVTLSPADFTATCGDGAEPLLASVKTPAQPNANPSAPAMFMDGQPVTADTCVAPSSKHAFGFVFQPSDRDEGEALIASMAVTAGELDRQYSSLEPNEPAPKEAVLDWQAPASGNASAYVVVRDSHGGTAFTRATICISSP
jgi:hypothetical protein